MDELKSSLETCLQVLKKRKHVSDIHHAEKKRMTWIARRCDVSQWVFIVTDRRRGVVFLVGLLSGDRYAVPLSSYFASYGEIPRQLVIEDINSAAAG